MTANVAPIYPNVGNINGVQVLTANTALDGTGTLGTNIMLVATGGTNGSLFSRIRVLHMGTNVVTVLRIFKNNGSTNATAANNLLLFEVTMAANTVSQIAASVAVEIPLGTTGPVSPGLVLKNGERLLAAVGTTIAAGIMTSAIGGDY